MVIKAVNKETRKSERRVKLNDLRNGLKDGYILFLCSWHKNAAKDHAPYQGKIYVDRYWRSRITDETLRTRIDEFIKENDVGTVQEIIRDPVYMLTRPNCKHRMIPIGIDIALNVDADVLLDTVKGARSYVRNLTYADRKKRKDKIKNAIADKNMIKDKKGNY